MCKLIRVLGTALALAFCSGIQAQIVTDGSVGPQITLNGTDVEVSESLGTRTGNNLFHSFQTFNIDIGESATFTGASDINNVISRVTGDEVSNIQGVLRSQVGAADFYFVNPAGVTFSEGGSVDVPASFHLSTADELYFADGAVLVLNNPTSSTLSIATPEAFGFLGGGAEPIQIRGAEIDLGSSMDSNEGMTLSAGDLILQDSPTVLAPGDMRLVAVGGASVRFDLQNGAESVPNGNVEVTNGSVGIGPGRVADNLRIEAGDITVANGTLVSGRGGVLEVNSTNQVTLIDGSRIGSNGNVQLTADQLLITDLSSISSETEFDSTDNAGNLEVTIAELATLLNGGRIVSTTRGAGDAGVVQVTAGQLLIDGQDSFTGIASDAFGSGNAGNIEVTIADVATLQNGGRISSSTFDQGDGGIVRFTTGQLLIDGGSIGSDSFGPGNGGSVEVTIAEVATIQNRGGISSTGFSGDAGNVQFTAGQLLIDGGFINSDTSGFGNGGNVEVTIAEAAILNNGGISSTAIGGPDAGVGGDAGNVQFTAGQLLIDDGFISSDTVESGNAGSVRVTIADLATLQNGGQISSSTNGAGDAGAVQVTAGQLLIDSPSIFPGIESDTRGTGKGGSVEVTIAEVATLLNGGRISSSTFDQGDGGNVWFTAGQLLIDGGSIGSDSFGPGNGGSVEVTIAEVATIQNRGGISSTGFSGDAGNVQFTAGQLLIDGGFINSDTSGFGNGGNVEVTIAEAAILNNGGISSAAFGGPDAGIGGDAGNVQFTAGQLLIDGGFINSDTFDSGNAGSVEVTIAEVATILNGGLISSSTNGSGNAGIVRLTAGRLLIDGQGSISDSFTGISSEATSIESTGNAGSVEVIVDGSIQLIDARITSAASSGATGAAGSVLISADRLVVVSDSQDLNTLPGVFTDSDENQAGPVIVNTNSLILRNGQLSTSTGSDSLDGGNVSIVSEVMVLDSALVQANANSGQGGKIDIDSAIIASGNEVAIGGAERVDFQFDGFNVIQAVAPSGVSVPPTINAPDIDVSGSLVSLDAKFEGAAELAFDPCSAFVAGAPSTFTIVGKGGLQSTTNISFDLTNELIDQFRGDISANEKSYYSKVAPTNRAQLEVKLPCE